MADVGENDLFAVNRSRYPGADEHVRFVRNVDGRKYIDITSPRELISKSPRAAQYVLTMRQK